MRNAMKLVAAGMVAGLAIASGSGAGTTPEIRAENFSPQNQLVDTSILFAAGAREGEQTLRGALGWPTFQEGRVFGINYRFDPDGYARFGPTPTLDTDFFEVLCNPENRLCTATKEPIQLWMADENTPRFSIRGIAGNTRIFASDGTSKIELPHELLAELSPSVQEALVSASELILETEGDPPQKISMSGFIPALVYIQWIAKRQDPSVFPTGWPLPEIEADTQRAALRLDPLTQAPKTEAPTSPLALAEDAATGPSLKGNSHSTWRTNPTLKAEASSTKKADVGENIQGLIAFCKALEPLGVEKTNISALPGESATDTQMGAPSASTEKSIRELQWSILKLSIALNAMEREMGRVRQEAASDGQQTDHATPRGAETQRTGQSEMNPGVTKGINEDEIDIILRALAQASRLSDHGREIAVPEHVRTSRPTFSDLPKAEPENQDLASDGQTIQEAANTPPQRIIIEIRVKGYPHDASPAPGMGVQPYDARPQTEKGVNENGSDAMDIR